MNGQVVDVMMATKESFLQKPGMDIESTTSDCTAPSYIGYGSSPFLTCTRIYSELPGHNSSAWTNWSHYICLHLTWGRIQ